MRQPNSKYPISSLLASSLDEPGSHPLASLLGYKNTSKLIRRLDEWLLNGKGDSGLLKKLSAAGILPEAALSQALKETLRIHEAEEKAIRQRAFRTHIYVETERLVEGGLMMGLLASKVKYIFDEQLASQKDEDRQLEIAVKICQRHFIENGGQCDRFGAIFSYKFYSSLDRGWNISPAGELSFPTISLK